MTAPFIPQKTREALASSHPEGTRHQAKIEIALSLLGNGIPPAAVVATLRDKFQNATEKEIAAIVDWCQSRNPTPSGYGSQTNEQATVARVAKKDISRLEVKLPYDEAARLFVARSTKQLPESQKLNGCDASTLFRALYKPDEFINIVCAFTTVEKNGVTKANPSGAGANKTRDEWLAYFAKNGVPSSDAGAWIRPNPVGKIGSGHKGANTDADITAFRFLLVEFDKIAKELQIEIYERLGIPLAAIIDSGGKSCHAWVRMDCADADEYREMAKRIYAALECFGVDTVNKNASRLSRLAGSVRKIGASGDGTQRLGYVAPETVAITEEQIVAMEARVLPAKFECKPMKLAIMESLELYEDIYINKKKTGIRTGFPRFDAITGGLKKSWFTVLAAETNVGKSSFALNIVNNVLRAGQGVALFTFEMDTQEIMDVLFALNATIDRNKFNHGYFEDSDFQKMAAHGQKMADFKLRIYDDPSMTITDVEEACRETAASQDLSLIVIDYLQLANCDGFRDNREQQVALISRKSKGLAKKMKCPVIGVSQLNEEGKMRESRGIAHDANCVIKLIADDDRIEAKIVKGRSIPKGSFYFSFAPHFCQFTETGCDDKLQRFIPQEKPNSTHHNDP